jgi:hypothetical protein
MKVAITAEHIKRGARGMGGKCPIALALAEKGETVYVGYQHVNVSSSRGWKQYRTSGAAKKFIDSFDKGNKVKPTTVELRAIPK